MSRRLATCEYRLPALPRAPPASDERRRIAGHFSAALSRRPETPSLTLVSMRLVRLSSLAMNELAFLIALADVTTDEMLGRPPPLSPERSRSFLATLTTILARSGNWRMICWKEWYGSTEMSQYVTARTDASTGRPKMSDVSPKKSELPSTATVR